MMLYSNNHGLYPYRMLLTILLEVQELNYIEFLYGPYIVQKTNNHFNISKVIERILLIRKDFPNIQLTNIDNRDKVREQLNAISPENFLDADVWSDRTTLGNKFRYCKNALASFDFIEGSNTTYRTPLSLKAGMRDNVLHILELSDPSRATIQNFYGEWNWII